MELGIFSKTYSRTSVESVFDAVKADGFSHIQFNMLSAGLASLPTQIDHSLLRHIHQQAQLRNLNIAALSGTFNMIHPDQTERNRLIKLFDTLASSCKTLGTKTITLCTGTRDPYDMWRYHASNHDQSAWNDLLRSMSFILQKAEENDIIVAVEPELSNVVNSSVRAKELLKEMQSDRLKIVMDAANLFDPSNVEQMYNVIDEAFYLLGSEIIIAHAKDFHIIDNQVYFTAVGKGMLDYSIYLNLLKSYQYNGALIIHGVAEDQVSESVTYLKNMIHD